MHELKPCPFCGYKARVETTRDAIGDYQGYVECLDCGATVCGPGFMTTVEERREVARRLRKCRGGWSSGECYYTIIHALGLPDTSREDGGAAIYARLADLIEPSCDRDALLALANEMDAEGLNGWAGPVNVGEYARRIREACGEARDE